MNKKTKYTPGRAVPQSAEDLAQPAEVLRLLPFYDMGGQAYFGYRMVLAAKLFDKRISEILSATGILTLPQWRVVSQLGLTATGTVRSLANGAAVDPAEVSRATRKLLQLGLVSRRENRANRRSPVFELTTAGRKSFHAVRKPITQFIQDSVEGLDSRDLEAANRVLWALTQGCLK